MKKMKLINGLVAVFLMLSVFAHAQAQAQPEAPDNDKIKTVTNDSSSPYYYPALMLRYESGDTTLTKENYHYLYYGYAFQDKYQPLEPVRGTDRILGVFERNEVLGTEEAVEVVSFAKHVMMQDPFSPSNINYMTYAYGILGDTVNEKINADRFRKILATIEESGTGLTEKSPWHILWFSHANDLAATKGFDISKRTIVSRSVEYAEVLKNDSGVKGFYFDYSRLYWKRPESMPEVNKNRGFLMNGMKVK